MAFLSLKKKTWKTILLVVVVVAVVMYFKDTIEGMCGCNGNFEEGFCGGAVAENADESACAYPYGRGQAGPSKESFSSCYRRKQIYLSSVDPDEPSGHADVNLERRWGKLYVNIQANLPYAEGGVFHTMWGGYHAYLEDSRSQKSISLGSLVRHGDRFYKLSTELLGDYSNYDQIRVYRQTEDYAPKLLLAGSITGQQCTSL